ncbi:MAG: CRTAC1 family protein [Salibacteraceae bacterium]
MKIITFLMPFVFLLIGRTENNNEVLNPETSNNQPEYTTVSESELMLKELQQLVVNGQPEDYYHWNQKIANQLLHKGNQGSLQQQMNTWFEYCKQSLNAGNSSVCVNELKSYFDGFQRPYEEIINANNKVMFELLALAHLRQAEQENCQKNHSAESCILPLQKGGLYQIKSGSESAIEIYSLLQDKFPTAKNKWLLNLAYMTLGDYPEKVPVEQKIEFPNKLERKDFPQFKEIATVLGLAQNGLSGSTCIDDFNNDGLLDVFTTSYGMEDNVQLFLRNKAGGFVNYTSDAGLKGIVSGLNCIHADYDNDGNIDILVLRGGWLRNAGTHPNSLLKNNGDGTFEDVTRSSKLLSYHPTQTASWGDYNNDGFLDVFIGNESTSDDSHPCELFKNNGDGSFSEISNECGLGGITGYIKGVTWGDINNDGWADLYVSVLGGDNLLFKNDTGTFHEIGMMAGVTNPQFSFPCWFWDVNNDGYQDVFVISYDLRNYEEMAGEFVKELEGGVLSCEKPKLYINNGDETFTESADQYGLSKVIFGMGANFGDLDNDGYLDFYVGTGAPDYSTIVPNRMFRNVNGEKFEEVTSAGNFGHIQKGHGVAFADLDRDGDQDIYTVMGGAYEGDLFTNILYKNPISNNNWIVLELEGTRSNKSAIGVKIEVELVNGRKLFRTVSTGGTFGVSPLQQEIGLGKSNLIKSIAIQWPNSSMQIINDIMVNQKIKIVEGNDSFLNVDYTLVPFQKSVGHHHHH